MTLSRVRGANVASATERRLANAIAFAPLSADDTDVTVRATKSARVSSWPPNPPNPPTSFPLSSTSAVPGPAMKEFRGK